MLTKRQTRLTKKYRKQQLKQMDKRMKQGKSVAPVKLKAALNRPKR